MSEKSYYVYAYLDPRKSGKYEYNNLQLDFEPFYIGKGKGKRKLFHLWAAKQGKEDGNPHKFRKILNILNTGMEPIIVEVSSNLTSEEALELERSLITIIGKAIDSVGPLVNILDGGESNPMDDEHIAEKVRQAHIGAKRSEEARRKMSEAAQGKKLSKEHVKHITDSLQGNCRAGKKVICYNVQTEEELTFPSVLQASKVLKISSRNIYSFITKGNKKNNVKGWRFYYEVLL